VWLRGSSGRRSDRVGGEGAHRVETSEGDGDRGTSAVVGHEVIDVAGEDDVQVAPAERVGDVRVDPALQCRQARARPVGRRQGDVAG